MATWSEVQQYIRSKFVVDSEPSNDLMRLIFETDNGRSQLLFVEAPRNIDGLPNFVGFFSPVGARAKVPADKLLDIGYKSLGVVVRAEFIGIYHAALIDTIDAQEIDDPIHLVTAIADLAERDLTGKDDF